MADAASQVQIILEAVNRASGELNKVRQQLGELDSTASKTGRGLAALSTHGERFKQVLEGVSEGLKEHLHALPQVAEIVTKLPLPMAVATGAVAAFGLAAFEAAHKIGEYAQETRNIEEATGLSQIAIGGLKVAAAEQGRTFESIQVPLTMFIRKLGEARAGSKDVNQTFRDLHVVLTDKMTGAALSTGEVMRQVATSLRGIEDPAERARLGFELFGRTGEGLIAVLEASGREAETLAQRMGVTLSPAAQKVALEASAANTELNLALQGLANTLAVMLAPAGIAVTKALQGIVTSIRSIFVGVDTSGADDIVSKLHEIGDAADKEAPKVRHMREELERIATMGRETGATSPQPTFLDRTLAKVNPKAESAGDLFGAQKTEEKLTAEQQKQYDAVKLLIEQMQMRVSIGAITLNDEIKALDGMKAQVVSKKELLLIQQSINNAQDQQYAKTAALIKLIKQGNVDLLEEFKNERGPMPPAGNAGRPELRNPDGSISTERTITIGTDQGYVNIPTIVNGIARSAREAIDLFNQGLNPAIAKFKTEAEAISAAAERSKDIGAWREFVKSLTPGLGKLRPLGVVSNDTPTFDDKPMHERLPSYDSEGTSASEIHADTIVKFTNEITQALGDEGLASVLSRATDASGKLDETLLGLIGTVEMAQSSSLDLGKAIGSTFVGAVRAGVRNFVSDISQVIAGTKKIGQAFIDMIISIEQAVLEETATKIILRAIGMQQGGTWLGAQSGLVIAGTRGLDGVPVKVGRGETVLSHSLTDKLDMFLLQAMRGSNSGGQSPRTVSVHFGEGSFQVRSVVADSGQIRDVVRNQFMPEIATAVRRAVAEI